MSMLSDSAPLWMASTEKRWGSSSARWFSLKPMPTSRTVAALTPVRRRQGNSPPSTSTRPSKRRNTFLA
jgi:hypothetical protein